MATDRQVLLDVPAHCEEGCRLQLWVQGGAFRIGAACDVCQTFILELVKEHYPEIEVKNSP